MMVSLLLISPRRVTFELDTHEKYETDEPYEVYINGQKKLETRKVVQTVDGLLPDTDVEMTVRRVNSSETLCFHTPLESVTLNVREMNAAGDGTHDDTAAIQAAIFACPPNGRVLIPAGRYRVTSLFLKSDIVLEIARNAELLGTTQRSDVPVLPGMVQRWDESGDYNLGSWEGNPLDCFAAMLTGIDVHNILITGEGTLDGCASEADWWQDDRAKIVAFRPRMVFLNRCQNVTLNGITIRNSPSWTIHPYFSRGIRILGVNLCNPWDSPNTDGIDPESVSDMEIAGVSFSLGDDCVAVKSGKYYMGSTYGVPSQDIRIRHCRMKNGHGAVTIGSENSAGVYRLHVSDCLFENTDRGLRIKTRRGRGEKAIVGEICFENIRMNNVRTPIVVNCYYNCCDPDRHSEYVRSKTPLPVDARTPSVRDLQFRNMECENCHVAAAFAYGLPERKIDLIEMENVHFTYAEHPSPMEPAMMDGIDEKTVMQGLYFNNVHRLKLRNVTVCGCSGEPLVVKNVDEICEE